jgi:hypothetical protein
MTGSRSLAGRAGTILALVALVVVLAGPAGALTAGPGSSRVAASHAASSATPLAPTAPAAPAPAVSSGAGVFFTNDPVPLPKNQTCYAGPGTGTCANITNEPSINYTSTGVLAMAYNAVTNQSVCGAVAAASAIGFTRSTNHGTSWSAPIYLGNTNCTEASEYPSAWEPSLTSLANGTLALVYIQYNLSGSLSYYNFVPYSSEVNTPFSRLVFTESYDGGVHWTTPYALNTSVVNPANPVAWAPERPWISAVGDTVYVTWENFTNSPLYPGSYYPNLQGGASIGSHLVVSTDGGAHWSAPIDLPVTTGVYYPFYEHVAMNPTVLAAPNGSLYVSYVTNVSYATACAAICVQSPTLTGNVVLGESRDNGTTFRWSTIASAVALNPQWGNFYDPSPQLAVDPASGQLYVTYSAAVPGTYCYAGTPVFCDLEAEGATEAYFANSSNGGQSWTTPHMVDPALLQPNHGQENETYNPALTVSSGGVVNLELTSVQYGACVAACPFQEQLYFNSTDHGATFTGGYVLSGNYTNDPYQWDGEYDTMASAGGHVWIAYVQDLCPAWATTGPCYMYGSSSGRAQVTVAQPFTGAGVTLTYSELGVPNGDPWSVDVLGNERVGVAPANLSVSGVPTGQPMNWVLPWSNVSYGEAYAGVTSVSTPALLTVSTTVSVAFTEYVQVDVSTVPVFNQCYGGGCLNWNVATAGLSWVPVGTGFSESVTPASLTCAYCEYVNASYLGWVGSGNGSVSTTAGGISFVANGAVNETAYFQPNAVCQGSPPTATCTSGGTFPVQFNETGLPAGVSWTVTADGITGTSSSSHLILEVPNGTVDWTAWTIPSGTGKTWLATSPQASEIQVPYTPYVDLSFAKVSLTGSVFPVGFNAVGLPNGTAWSANLSDQLAPFTATNSSLNLASGTYNVTFPSLYSENGTAYTVTTIDVIPDVENATGTTGSSTVRYAFNGPAEVYAMYQPSVEVSVQGGANGTAGPASQWVAPGGSATIHETPNVGYVFAGWAGYGSGATGAGQEFSANPIVYPTGPVLEVASFVPLARGSYVAHVNATGVPSNATVTVSVGNRSASGPAARFSLTDLSTGWYPLTVPNVYANATGGIEYTFASATVTGSGTLYPNGTLEVVGNLSLSVSYGTSYLLSVSAIGPGTTSLAPGVHWYSANATAAITATSTAGDRFLGWVGTGPGSYTGAKATANVTLAGPLGEIASFALPATAPTYALTVEERGLPADVDWSVSLGGGLGTSGSTASLVVAGLSGTYPLTVPDAFGATAGVRYVSNWSANASVPVSAPGAQIVVGFSEQFAVTISAGSGGTASPVGTTWLASGATETISAAPSSGQTFLGWTGSGSGSYSGTNGSQVLTVGGAISEVATFAPTASPVSVSPSQSGSSTTGLAIALAAFVALLVVGAVVGMLLARRRPPAARTPPPAAEPMYGDTPPTDGSN